MLKDSTFCKPDFTKSNIQENTKFKQRENLSHSVWQIKLVAYTFDYHVFYNILARCYVLIDLKADRLTHQDLGQMQMYVNYYTRELMNPGDNPPIGIVLCADKNDSVVEYTLPEGENQIYAAKYMTYMPSKEELKQLISQ